MACLVLFCFTSCQQFYVTNIHISCVFSFCNFSIIFDNYFVFCNFDDINISIGCLQGCGEEVRGRWARMRRAVKFAGVDRALAHFEADAATLRRREWVGEHMAGEQHIFILDLIL